MTANCHYDPCKARADNARASGRNVMKIGFCAAVMAAGLLVPGAPAKAATYEVTTRADIVFAEHDGVKLLGDLYAPKGLDKAPVLVAVHGGGWQVGTRKFYSNWGPISPKMATLCSQSSIGW